MANGETPLGCADDVERGVPVAVGAVPPALVVGSADGPFGGDEHPATTRARIAMAAPWRGILAPRRMAVTWVFRESMRRSYLRWGHLPLVNRMIAVSSARAILRWTRVEASSEASAALGMFPHSIRTFGTVVRFRPARSVRKM